MEQSLTDKHAFLLLLAQMLAKKRNIDRVSIHGVGDFGKFSLDVRFGWGSTMTLSIIRNERVEKNWPCPIPTSHIGQCQTEVILVALESDGSGSTNKCSINTKQRKLATGSLDAQYIRRNIDRHSSESVVAPHFSRCERKTNVFWGAAANAGNINSINQRKMRRKDSKRILTHKLHKRQRTKHTNTHSTRCEAHKYIHVDTKHTSFT